MRALVTPRDGWSMGRQIFLASATDRDLLRLPVVIRSEPIAFGVLHSALNFGIQDVRRTARACAWLRTLESDLRMLICPGDFSSGVIVVRSAFVTRHLRTRQLMTVTCRWRDWRHSVRSPSSVSEVVD